MLPVASSAGCVTPASLLMNEKRRIDEQFSGGKETGVEKSIGRHGQGEGGEEGCENGRHRAARAQGITGKS